LDAFNVIEYVVPFFRPEIVAVVRLGETVKVLVVAPAVATMLYPVSALPPLLAGAVQRSVALAFPRVAVTAVGASGTVIVTAFAALPATSEVTIRAIAPMANLRYVPAVRTDITFLNGSS
jgi:hypothetical protein